MASWIHRGVLAGLLLTAYLYAWTPLRTAWTIGATAVLERVASASQEVSARPTAHTIRIASANEVSMRYRSPAGVEFLLPALFLVMIVPVRPRLGLFVGGHVGLATLTVILMATGLFGLPGGFGLAAFIQQYGVDAYSLAVPVLVLKAQNT